MIINKEKHHVAHNIDCKTPASPEHRFHPAARDTDNVNKQDSLGHRPGLLSVDRDIKQGYIPGRLGHIGWGDTMDVRT